MVRLFTALCLSAVAHATVGTTGRVELHLHLDGAVDGDFLLEVAQFRRLKLPLIGIPSRSWEIDLLVNSKSAFSRFDIINDILGGSPAAAFLIGQKIAARQKSLNVTYTELRYDPRRMSHSSYDNSSVPMSDIVEAVSDGLRNGSLTHGVEVYSLLVAMRGEPAASCDEVIDLAAATQESWRGSSAPLGAVVGVDLAGDEGTYNNSMYVDCFRRAKLDLGLNTTVHSGEMGADEQRLEDVRVAVLSMEVDRIGHGYAASKSTEVMALLRERGVHLEACPGTALAEGSVDAIAEFARFNLSFGLSEDDPSPYFGNCSYECIEAIAADCKGGGVRLSAAAFALCVARRVRGEGGVGLSRAAIDATYLSARKAAFVAQTVEFDY